jgi:cytochrome b6-f complex iron-sulfur subunit
MTRKEFMAQIGVTALTLPVCLGVLGGCSGQNPVPVPTNVDFTIDITTGNLSKDGGYIVKNGVIVARVAAGSFIAVSAACTHEGTNVQYVQSRNDFECPSHGATFSSTGKLTQGPARTALAQYNTSLSGNSLRVFS